MQLHQEPLPSVCRWATGSRLRLKLNPQEHKLLCRSQARLWKFNDQTQEGTQIEYEHCVLLELLCINNAENPWSQWWQKLIHEFSYAPRPRTDTGTGGNDLVVTDAPVNFPPSKDHMILNNYHEYM